MSKKLTVYTTSGKSGVEIETNAENWSQLQRDLSTKGISYGGMKAVTGDKVTLEHAEAKLPESDFSLFLFPVKTKSGAGYKPAAVEKMSYGELKTEIKGLKEQYGDAFAAHFGNYTQKSTADLKALLISFNPKAKVAAPAKKETGVAPTSKPAAVSRKAVAEAPKEKPAKEEKPAKAEAPAKEKVTEAEVSIDLSSEDRIALESAAAIIKRLLNGEVKKEVKQLPAKGSSTSTFVPKDKLDATAREMARGFGDIKGF